MIDLDHLKEYNDEFGHLAGDACIRRVAGHLTGHPDVTVYRLGGEEFAAHLTGPDRSAVAGLARTLVDAVADACIRSPRPGQPVTISLGLAFLDDDGPAVARGRADTALYRAKASGRNRAIIAGLIPRTARCDA